jgi:hypothetical protein
MTTATQHPHRPRPETAFDQIVDPTLVPPGIVINTVHESPGGVGNAYEWTYRLLGIPIRGVMVYTQCVPQRLSSPASIWEWSAPPRHSPWSPTMAAPD